MLTVDRHFDGVFFDAGEGGEPMLFAHLSWLYFTGIHTVMVVAALAVISEIVPTFSRKPLFSHSAVAGSLVAVGVLGTLAWMQNLYASPLRRGLRLLHDARRDLAAWSRSASSTSSGSLTMWDGAVSTRAPLVLAITGAASRSCSGSPASSRPRSSASGLLLENTVAAQQDTILVITGFVLAMFAGASLLASQGHGARRPRGARQGRRRRSSS